MAVVRELFEAFNEGDLDGCVALAAEDFELFDAPTGQVYRGPAGLREWLAVFRTALPDARTEIVSAFSEGGLVATEHIGRGTHSGPLAGPGGEIPPTGRPVEIRIGELYEVREGRLTSMRAFYDSSTLLRQLGLLPPAGSAGDRAMTAAMGAQVRVKRAIGR